MAQLWKPDFTVHSTTKMPVFPTRPDLQEHGVVPETAKHVAANYGGGGSQIGIMAAFANRLFADKQLKVVRSHGASGGSWVALADALGADSATRIEWVLRMPTKLLLPKIAGPGDVVRGLRRAAFVPGAKILEQHIQTVLDDYRATHGVDGSTFGAFRNHGAGAAEAAFRLGIQVQVGTQKGMQHGRVSPEQRAEIIRQVSDTIGLDVAKNIVRMHIPRVQTLDLPTDAERFGLGAADQLSVAATMATSQTVPGLFGATVNVTLDDGTVYAFIDGASGIDTAIHPDVRVRDRSWQLIPRAFAGPGGEVSDLPNFGFRMAGKREQPGTVLYPGRPEIGMPPAFVFVVKPGNTGAFNFDFGKEKLELDMTWGDQQAAFVVEKADSRIDQVVEQWPEIVADYRDREAQWAMEPQKAAEQTVYSKVYDALGKFVADKPAPAGPDGLLFQDSSIGI